MATTPLSAEEACAAWLQSESRACTEPCTRTTRSGLPFFTEARYSASYSRPQSTRKIYELGIDSIPSESECYPAKLAHGHVTVADPRRDVEHIFYPSIPYERNEFPDANNHYNCPIVTSYPENIKNNMDPIVHGDVDFIHPFLNFQSEETIFYRLRDELGQKFALTGRGDPSGCSRCLEELAACRNDMRKKGEETIRFLNETGNRGIVLAGRPYHIDPEVNHGIPELITSYNIAVLTEDSISHLNPVERPLNVMDQWMYHSRLYAAANYVKTERRSRPHPAEFLRLRTGRRHDRSAVQ